MNKAVIFDLDGTLLDTVPDIMDNINIMLEHFGYKTRSENEIKRFVGCGARNLVALSVGKELTKEELDERLIFYNTAYTASVSPKTHLFDGIEVVLKTLKSRGYKLAILTNKPQETTNTVVREYLQDFGFDMIVGQSGSVKCKPDKTATLKILDSLKVEAKNAFFVGDGETDVETSINAGTCGIAALWGYRDKEQLKNAGAKTFATAPIELLELIK